MTQEINNNNEVDPTIEFSKLNPIEFSYCTRCGGSGHYSFCSMYGTTCFKCGGSGKKLTKRGATVQSYLTDLRLKEVEARDLKVGNFVNYLTRRFIVEKVGEITKSFYKTTSNGVDTSHWREEIMISSFKNNYSMNADSKVKVHTGIGNLVSYQMAIEFQKTLTKSGKPTKTTSEKDRAWYEAKFPAKK